MDAKPSNPEILKPPSEVPLLQFTLRHLLLFMAGVSVVFMILTSLEGYAAVVFGVGVLLVGAHVLSTTIGSRLRESADAIRAWEQSRSRIVAARNQLPSKRPELPRPSQLQVRTSCSRKSWWFVGSAMIGGGLLGSGFLKLLAGPMIGWPDALIAAISAALLVGWGALILAGICGVAQRASKDR